MRRGLSPPSPCVSLLLSKESNSKLVTHTRRARRTRREHSLAFACNLFPSRRRRDRTVAVARARDDGGGEQTGETVTSERNQCRATTEREKAA